MHVRDAVAPQPTCERQRFGGVKGVSNETRLRPQPEPKGFCDRNERSERAQRQAFSNCDRKRERARADDASRLFRLAAVFLGDRFLFGGAD